MSKTHIISKNSFDIITSAVNKAVDMVRPTYGPAGNKVIISKVLYKMVPDDGVQIMRDLELPDPSENAVLSVIRETAVKTNDRVGDGTTSSMIMLQAIMNEVAKKPHFHGRLVAKELQQGAKEAKEQIVGMAKPVKTKEELKQVARISYDDEKTAEIIANTCFQVGKDGIVTVENSQTLETTAELTEGLTLQRGYISPHMVSHPDRMEAIIEKPYILLTDYRLTEAADVIPIMNELVANKIMSLVIVAENVEQSALATLVINKLQGKFFAVAITLPQVEDRKVFLEDLALLTGAKVFSNENGNKLQDAKIDDLGRAERFIGRKESSVFVNPKGKKSVITDAIASLRNAMGNATVPADKERLNKRLALFTNKIGVIKVGAPTENEQKARKFKVEDAVNAVKAAFKGGVVCGAGLTLSRLKTSSPILNEALKRPFEQLKENMGIEEHKELKNNEALNVVTGKIGNYLEVGVVDPADVLIAGVESAVSIASILVTTSGMIVEEPKEEK